MRPPENSRTSFPADIMTKAQLPNMAVLAVYAAVSFAQLFSLPPSIVMRHGLSGSYTLPLQWRVWRTGCFCGGIWRAAGGSKRERQEVCEAQIARFSEHRGVDGVHVVGRRSAGNQAVEWTSMDMAVVPLVVHHGLVTSAQPPMPAFTHGG